jgi:O-antigen ligase/Tfp pilus assembly protein PilF
MEKVDIPQLRPVIAGSVTVCVLAAIAPWMSGGRDPLALVIGAVALLLAFLLLMVQPEVRRPKLSWLSVSYMALLGWGTLSLLWTANRYSSALWLALWGLAGLVFVAVRTLARDDKGRRWLLSGYLITAAVFSLAGIVMYVTGSYERLTGSFYWPNPAAAYLMPAIILAVANMKQTVGRPRLLWVGAGALYVATAFLTDSRAALLVLVLSVAAYLLVSPSVRRFWIHLLFMLITSAVIVVASNFVAQVASKHRSTQIPGSRLAELASGDAHSTSDRLYYLSSAFDLWRQRPLQGTGAGTFGDRHPQVQRRAISASNDVHNIYVQVLSELGIVGALLLIAVIVWLLAGMARGVIADSSQLPLAIGLVALLLHAAVDIDARYPALLGLAALLGGLSYRPWRDGVGVFPRILLAPAVLATLCVTSWYWSQTYSGRAFDAQNDGDYELATSWDQRAQLPLTNPDILGAEGILWYTRGLISTDRRPDFAKALALVRRAQQADPFDGQHHQLEGRILLQEHDLAGATRAFEKALQLDPFDHPQYALDLASTQLLARQTDQALATAMAMLKLYPDQVLANRSADPTLRPALSALQAFVGNLYLQKGDMAQAKRAAQRAVAIYPESLPGRALQHQVTSQAQ